MRRVATVAIGLALTALASGCGGGDSGTETGTAGQNASAAPGATTDQRLYGRIRSLVRRGDHYELRFDPAWFASGVTANAAQADDQGTPCRPSACPPVANDNYVIDEGHRLLVYLLPAGARGTVLTRKGTSGGPFPSTTITGAQLARLVAGKSSLKLFEPLSTGVWIVVHVDTVRTFAQQYMP